MAKIWESNIFYYILRIYADWCTRQGYNHVTEIGLENIPKDGAVILAPNHCNTLMDAMLILQSSSKASAYGARADIFSNKTVAEILRFLKILPLARMRDGAKAVEKNNAIFEEVVDILDHDVPFCIFSEGTHHASHRIQPTRKGIWRIAFMAQEKLDKPVYIVPVGLDHEYFFRAAGDIDIRFGEPIKVKEMEGKEPLELNRLLHDRIQELVRRPDKDYVDENGNFVEYKAPRREKWLTALQIVVGIFMFPFFLVWGVLSLPLNLATRFLATRVKDKTWLNTIRFASRFVLVLLLTIVYGALAFIFLKWYWAVLILVLFWFSDWIFHWHLNYYQDLFNSLRK